MSADTLHRINDLVSPDQIGERFPELPKPKRVTVLETVDHNGDNAYDVVLVFPDAVPDKIFKKNAISPMVEWIREQIFQNRDSERWPYFWFRTESEDRAA
jgi:hypothetical protein